MRSNVVTIFCQAAAGNTCPASKEAAAERSRGDSSVSAIAVNLDTSAAGSAPRESAVIRKHCRQTREEAAGFSAKTSSADCRRRRCCCVRERALSVVSTSCSSSPSGVELSATSNRSRTAIHSDGVSWAAAACRTKSVIDRMSFKSAFDRFGPLLSGWSSAAARAAAIPRCEAIRASSCTIRFFSFASPLAARASSGCTCGTRLSDHSGCCDAIHQAVSQSAGSSSAHSRITSSRSSTNCGRRNAIWSSARIAARVDPFFFN